MTKAKAKFIELNRLEKMRAERINYIGSTDAAAILGLSRWRTRLQVWAEKTELIKPEDISKELRVRLGIKQEQIVAELFEEETGKKVQRMNETVYHPDYNFLAANIDRRVVGEDSLLECKTTSTWHSKEWEGEEIPQEYIVQCYHQLLVTGKSKVYLAGLIGNEKFVIKEIERDGDVIESLKKKELDFWLNFVVKKIQPKEIVAKDDEVLNKIYPQAELGTCIELSLEINKDIDLMNQYKNEIKVLDNKVSEIKNKLKSMIGFNEYGDSGNYIIHWSNIHKSAYTVAEKDYRELRIKVKEIKNEEV